MLGRLAVIVTIVTVTAAAPVIALDSQPYAVATAKTSGLCKTLTDQTYKPGKWTTFQGCDPFVLGGARSMFFSQLRLTCTKRPRYVKMRLARIHPDGSTDTTGTNTWVMGKNAPLSWSGSQWWESNTKFPIVAQFKIVGGQCVASERQFKWWQP